MPFTRREWGEEGSVEGFLDFYVVSRPIRVTNTGCTSSGEWHWIIPFDDDVTFPLQRVVRPLIGTTFLVSTKEAVQWPAVQAKVHGSRPRCYISSFFLNFFYDGEFSFGVMLRVLHSTGMPALLLHQCRTFRLNGADVATVCPQVGHADINADKCPELRVSLNCVSPVTKVGFPSNLCKSPSNQIG